MHWLNRVLARLLTSANILRRNENIYVNRERERETENGERETKEDRQIITHHIGISCKQCLALDSGHDH
jgi:hypothetical protein